MNDQSASPSPPRPELLALIRLRASPRKEMDRRRQILARRIDPTDPNFDPEIPNSKLAKDAGEDECNVSRWLKRWRDGVKDDDGEWIAPPMSIAALAPGLRGPKKGSSHLSDEDKEEILDQAALRVRRSGNPDRLPVTAVHNYFIAREEFTKEPAPGLAQIRALLKRVSFQDRLAWAGGAEQLKKGGGDPRLVVPEPGSPNLEWYLDQWVADQFVEYEDGESGRPVIVTPVDRYGGAFALGLAVHRRFTGLTVAEAVVDAIRRNGKPRVLRLDLGRENRTKYLRRGCELLGIELVHTTPLDPSVKGIIEQVHNSYREFCSGQPWHAPSDIKTKPLREEVMPSFATFTDNFTAFTYGEYNTREYTGQYRRGKLSRLEIRQAAKFTPITVSEDELQLLFAPAKEVTVHSRGVTVNGLDYYDPALSRRIGEKVWASQNREEVDVVIQDWQLRFVCVAVNAMARAAQMNDEGRREFTSDKRVLRNAIATQADERIGRARNRTDWLLHRAKTKRDAQEQAPPGKSVRQLTPVTGQTPRAVAVASAGRRQLKLTRYEGDSA